MAETDGQTQAVQVINLLARPDFRKGEIRIDPIPMYIYDRTLKDEIEAGTIDPRTTLTILEQMMAVRAFEEMIYHMRMGAFPALKNFDYKGPTHLSAGQEATCVGACSAIRENDYITSTHRGHGDGIAKGYWAILAMDEASLRARLELPSTDTTPRADLIEQALEDHVFRTAAELFGKEAGYCRGRGGGMHIADFTVGHLGANAIVGGSVGIATGAAYSARYRESGQVVLCFAGDGAFSNGIALESLNVAAMAQFTNELAKKPFGTPVIYLIINNLYSMTGKQMGEVTGLDYLARRATGFASNNMHAEVVNGMDVLAVRDSVRRAVDLCRNGEGPVLRELICYRYFGHSLSDGRTEYRSRGEEAAWQEVDPIKTFSAAIINCGVANESDIAALEEKVRKRNERAAVRAAESPDPDPEEITRYLFTTTSTEGRAPDGSPPKPLPRDKGLLTYKDAIKEAMIEEMARDRRVIFYGEDVADYGGAFKVTKGLLEIFGRDRVFNTSVSESAIIGTGVGAAMTGLRPIVELMYCDFALQSSDQISNQAAKWHYMSGGRVKVPMVIRVSIGGGKGYGGQHSQSLESIFCHTPGLIVACPSTPYDAKGLLKTAIRDDNPVFFTESQLLYNKKGPVPEDDYTIPFGLADIKREGKDVTVIAWSYLVHEAVKAADALAGDGIDVEVLDPRTLIPLDMETIAASVRKTHRVVIVSQPVRTGSYTAEIASRIQEEVFDYLDAPIERIGATDCTSPQAPNLEDIYLPSAPVIVEAIRRVAYRE